MTNAAAKLPRAAPPKHGQPFGWGNDELSKFLEAAHQNDLLQEALRDGDTGSDRAGSRSLRRLGSDAA